MGGTAAGVSTPGGQSRTGAPGPWRHSRGLLLVVVVEFVLFFLEKNHFVVFVSP